MKSIFIKDGYKYAICEQCKIDWNVPWQHTGWYVCPICTEKNRMEQNDVERKGGRNPAK